MAGSWGIGIGAHYGIDGLVINEPSKQTYYGAVDYLEREFVSVQMYGVFSKIK
jgi:hypothetical protein